jgi:tetratricopeptide (TPR) repeat protein
MPRSPTDVAHVAFTHHRVAVHERLPKESDEPSEFAILRPYKENPRLGVWDKKRSLGLAYWELANQEKQPERVGPYKKKAFQMLSEVYEAGMRDTAVLAKLSRLQFEAGMENSLALADEALTHPGIAGSDRCTALFVRGAEQLKREQYLTALDAFHELVDLRRHPHDWLLMGECRKMLGQSEAARSALQHAARINPRIGH